MSPNPWYGAVASLETCVLCGTHGVQVAHRNQGKAMGKRVADCLTAALCPACHFEIDNGRDMTREQRRAQMDDAIVRTFELLVRRGLVGLL